MLYALSLLQIFHSVTALALHRPAARTARSLHGKHLESRRALSARQARLGATVLAMLLMAPLAVGQIQDSRCTVTINGRIATVNPDGSFQIDNVPFALNTPYRITEICELEGITLFGQSKFFTLVNNGRIVVPPLSLSPNPPASLEMITAAPDMTVLTAPGATTQIRVQGSFSDGTLSALNLLTDGTNYLSSNPAIITVDPNGIATVAGDGTAAITATNQGNTAVTLLSVSLGDPLTAVEGFVMHPSGPVTISTVGGGSVAVIDPTIGNGFFRLDSVVTLSGPILLEVSAPDAFALAGPFEPVAGGITDAGIISNLRQGTWWSSDTSSDWDDATSWNGGVVPGIGENVIIQRPTMIVVTHTANTHQIGEMNSSEALTITGGTLDVEGPSLVQGTFSLSGGIRGGAGAISLGGPFLWSGGTMTGVGRTIANAGGLITSGSNKFLNGGHTLENGGTMTWLGGHIFVRGSSEFRNLAGGVFDIQSDRIVLGGFGGGTISNLGTIRKLGGVGTTSVDPDVALDNAGLIDVQSGTLRLQGGGSSTGSFTIASGATCELAGTQALQDGVTVTGAGLLRLTGSGVGITGTVTADNVEVANGTLQNAGTLDVVSGLIWSGGTLTDVGRTVANAGGSITAGGNKFLIGGHTLENGGTMTWLAGNFFVRGSSVFRNLAGGVLDLQSDNNVSGGFGGGTISNLGTIRKSGGVGTTTVSSDVALDNVGLVDVQSGTLRLLGGGSSTGSFTIASGAACDLAGTQALQDGVTVTGAGPLRLSGSGVGVTGTVTAENVEVANGTLQNAGTLAVTSGLVWSGGTMTGVGRTIANAGGLITSGSNKFLNGGHTLENGGTMTWLAGNVFIRSGSEFRNPAGSVLDIQSDNNVAGGIGSGTISNLGTIRKTSGVGVTDIASDVALDNAGLVDVRSGTLRLRSGSSSGPFVIASGATCELAGPYVLQAGVAVTGAGLLRLTGNGVSITGAVTADHVEVAGATLQDTGTLNIVGGLVWSGGTMTGVGRTIANSGGSITAASNKFLNGGHTLENVGSMTWLAGSLFLRGGSRFRNLAGSVFDIQSDNNVSGGFGGGTISNLGTIRKSGGVGTTTVSSDVALDNVGLVDVQSGTLRLQGGGSSTGSFTIASGATCELAGTQALQDGVTVTGAGPLRLTGNGVSITGAVTADHVEVANGTLQNAGTLNIVGGLVWSGGTMTGVGRTIANAGGLITSGSNKFLNGGHTLETAGTMTWLAGNVFIRSGSEFRNLAGSVFDIQSDNNVSGGFGGGTISNLGTIRKSGGVGTTTIASDVALDNAGLIDIQSGTLHVAAGVTQTAGSIQLGGGSIGGGLIDLQSGGLSGIAGSSVQASVTNGGGRVEPAGAGSVGSLSVTGTYAQQGGTLAVDLAGNGINDVLNITGAATLGGTLELVLDPAFTPAAGNSFLILDAASLSGTFTIVPPVGVNLQANYDPIAGTVTLVVL